MARLSFRDRFFSRPVANAMMSPGAILLAGAGAGVAILSGLPLIVAPVAAVGAWAARVLVAVPSNEPTMKIDPFKLPQPWRDPVTEALKAQVRYEKAVQLSQGGAIRARLKAIGERIADGVDQVHRIAQRGYQLSEGLENIDAEDAQEELDRLEASSAATGSGADPVVERTRQALRSQLETAERLTNLLEGARSRLKLLDARLDESVARAIELSLQVDHADDLSQIDADIDNVVTEMEALRQALDETAHISRGTPGTQ